jgi:flagellar export protein FliJ
MRSRLKGLLQLRKAHRDECRGELAETLRAQGQLREQREALEDEIDLMRMQRAVNAGAVNIEQLRETARYASQLRSRQKTLEQELQAATSEAERRHKALVEADQQLRIIERLQTRQTELHQAEQQRHEQRQMDEMALLLRQRETVSSSATIRS